MGNNYIVWVAAAAAAAVLVILLVWLRGRRGKAAAPETERAPVAVEGSNAFTGMRGGVKYWIYYEGGEARLEIEAAAGKPAPFVADARNGKAQLPGDARDADIRELLRLGALRVEAAESTGLISAHFPERVLNLNTGTRFGPLADADNANKAADLLAAIRDKGR